MIVLPMVSGWRFVQGACAAAQYCHTAATVYQSFTFLVFRTYQGSQQTQNWEISENFKFE